jgi:Predicted transcriptional regulators
MGLTAENSNAIALGLIGDEWNLAITRLAIMSGVRRYKDFRDQLGIANSVLTARLRRLTEAGVFTMAQYSEAPRRLNTCSPTAAATCGRCC